MFEFSAKKRKNLISDVSGKKFDVVVIGGGITGSGIALDAASRGLNVLVLEKKDFAFGTSSRSTKLVHGGLRYLKNLEFDLVHEVGRERAIVHNNAMHIVIPAKMILPIIKGGTLGKLPTAMALTMYDWLAGVKKDERKKMLTREETIKIEPLLESDLLKSSGLYFEYKTDDSRLTIEVMKKAIEYGAKAINYAKVTDFIYENGHVVGVKVTDTIDNQEFEVFGHYIVNATGIWIDELRKKDNSLFGKRLHITKGIHIVVPHERFPINHSIYFDVGDGRMVFAIPRYDKVYIGTTDTDYKGDLDNPDITSEDVAYLLRAVEHVFPSVQLTFDDVLSAWTGLRPLIHQDGKSPSELSRRDEIFVSQSGLISIAGGKLTGYRVMARKVVDLIRKLLIKEKGMDIGKCKTQNIKLSGGEFQFDYEPHVLMDYADSKYDEAKQSGISVEEFKVLFYRYGTNIDAVTEKAFDFYNQTKDTDTAWLYAQLSYSIENEMTWALTDFFMRRTNLIYFWPDKIPPVLERAADFMAKELGWSNGLKDNYLSEMQQEIAKTQDWKNS